MRRRVRWVICVLLTAAFIATACGTQPTETAEGDAAVASSATSAPTPPSERTETSLDQAMPSGDRDALGNFTSLTVARLVIEGTVVELRGPEVTVSDDQFDTVDYERGSDGMLPSVMVKIEKLVAELDRENPFTEMMALTLEAARQGSTIEIMHADGQLEVGHTYTMFVGPWEPELANISYAVDKETDRPAPGLDRWYYESNVRPLLLEVSSSRGETFSSDAEMITEFARAYDPAFVGDEEYADTFAVAVEERLTNPLGVLTDR